MSQSIGVNDPAISKLGHVRLPCHSIGGRLGIDDTGSKNHIRLLQLFCSDKVKQIHTMHSSNLGSFFGTMGLNSSWPLAGWFRSSFRLGPEPSVFSVVGLGSWYLILGAWVKDGSRREQDTSSCSTDGPIWCIITVNLGSRWHASTPAIPKGSLFPKLDRGSRNHWLGLPTVGH